MRTRLSHWFRRTPAHRGQTLVLFALMSLTLIAGLGLVIDAGVNYGQRRTMQNAADTAALAGVRILSRQNTFPGTTRQMVWNAVFDTAKSNGVADDPRIFQCIFIDNNRDTFVGNSCNIPIDGGGTTTIPGWASGVQVRVSETHQTFFMRALGTTTSGTSATSRAQVRTMVFMPTADITFAICGVQTATVNTGTVVPGSPFNILQSEQILDWTRPQPSPSASPFLKWQATENYTQIVNSAPGYPNGAYKFDWNVRDGSGNLSDLGGPTFQIYTPTVEPCDAKGGTWLGAIVQEANQDIQMQRDGNTRYAPAVKLNYGLLGGSTPAHSINGTLGCKTGQLPPPLAGTAPRMNNLPTDGCVMFVPITDNGGGANPRQNTVDLRARVWGVFYVFNVGGNYFGWLIKNYPVHEDGQNFWTPAYTGPITISLVKDD